MSGVEGRVAEVLGGHCFVKALARCTCGSELGGTGNRMKAHRTHLAAVLAPVIAAERAAALREAADAGPSSTPTDELWASFLRERANREEARNV